MTNEEFQIELRELFDVSLTKPSDRQFIIDCMKAQATDEYLEPSEEQKEPGATASKYLKDLGSMLGNIVYLKMLGIQQDDGYSLACKTRMSVKEAIVKEFLKKYSKLSDSKPQLKQSDTKTSETVQTINHNAIIRCIDRLSKKLVFRDGKVDTEWFLKSLVLLIQDVSANTTPISSKDIEDSFTDEQYHHLEHELPQTYPEVALSILEKWLDSPINQEVVEKAFESEYGKQLLSTLKTHK